MSVLIEYLASVANKRVLAFATQIIFFCAANVGVCSAEERILYDDFDTQLKSSSELGALGNGLFGDKTDFYTGVTDFWVTDVSLSGNNKLPVEITRRFDGGDDGVGEYLNWTEFEVPYLSGIFPFDSASRELNGWFSRVRGSYEKRCSMVTPPPEVKQSSGKESTFMAEEYFHGIRVNLPGGDSQLLLDGADVMPSDGQAYRWSTNNGWRFSCLPQLKNGVAGEGFLARDSDGNKYYFDWLVSGESVQGIRKFTTMGETLLQRREQRMYATRIEDRFGNSVEYGYEGEKLVSISSSDGRALRLSYGSNSKLASVTDGARTWQYAYSSNGITLTYPDGSVWASSLYNGITRRGNNCESTGPVERFAGDATLVLQHPSGAIGRFSFSGVRRGLSFVPWVSVSGGWCNQIPKDYDSIALKSKSIQGPGLDSLDWLIEYGSANGCYVKNDNQGCTSSSPATRTVEVRQSNGDFIRYEFGNKIYENDGALLKAEWSGAQGILRTEYKTWQSFGGVGLPLNSAGDHYWEKHRRVIKNNGLVQDGVGFHADVNQFDSFLRPVSVGVWSSLGYGRTDSTVYYDDTARWVLGQVASQTNQDTGKVVSRTEFDSATSLPVARYSFERLDNLLSYNSDGTLASITNGRYLATKFSGWKRGIPQRVEYPATPDSPSGSGISAIVDDNGLIRSVADENGFVTTYGYDLMGRLSSVAYPGGDSTAWNNVVQSFSQVNAPDRGLPPGHWERVRIEGARRTHTYYDALWRPVMVLDYDGDDATRQTQTITRYDASGRIAFQSYPTKQVGDFRATLPGTALLYDALGRVTESRQDSEHGYLYTTTAYLAGFQTKVRNPRGFETITHYEVYDKPSYEMPRTIVHPEGAITDISRNKFGQTVNMVRRNADFTAGVWRHYVYDAHQLLCKTIEPETGAIVMDYDPAGNLSWTAAGLYAPDTSQCNRSEAIGSGRMITRTHDARDRLLQLTFADGNGNQSWMYTPDGLPAQITTFNKGDGQSVSDANVVNHYSYNKRRFLEAESSSQLGWYSWTIGYGYDGNGNLRWHTYPTGLSLDYAPNALGQPTQVKSQDQTFASGVTYYPNGKIAQFTYGNGLIHRMTQNARQLPRQVNNGTSNLVYDYDNNGNPVAIRDVDAVQGVYSGNRDMSYDGLDRLTNAHLHWQLNESYVYDVFDNIKRKSDTTGKVRSYWYDASNRSTNIQDESGASVVGLGYDVQGNLQNKNGQNYFFDLGNRLRQVAGKEFYRYEGNGRRVFGRRQDGAYSLSIYSQSGQLVYDEKHGSLRVATDYLYLGGSVIAARERDWLGNPAKILYQHTDALGGPTATTNELGQDVKRINYAPFGAVISEPAYDGVGYAGHVMDSSTGFSYMQQRYYDPAIGLFLSADPVQAYADPVRQFHRYRYASNSPFAFSDPDGRRVRYAFSNGATVVDQFSMLAYLSFSKTAANEFRQIINSSRLYTIEFNGAVQPWYNRESRTIIVNPTSGLRVKSTGMIQSPALGGFHEITHAAQHDRTSSEAMAKNMETTATVVDKPGGGIIVTYAAPPEEARATRIESEAARELREPVRSRYGDTDGDVRTCGMVSRERC